MPVDTVGAVLSEKQIDYDILPSDKLDRADRYEYIIVPYAEFLPEEIQRKLKAVSKAKVMRLKSGGKKELAALVCSLPRAVNISGAGAKRIRAMKLQGKEKYFLHNEGNSAANVAVECYGKSVKISDMLCGTEEILPVKNGKVCVKLRPGQAVMFESLQENAPKNRNAKTQNIPFEKTGEYDTSITYLVTAQINASDELRFVYEGEWACIAAGGKEYDFIGGAGVIRNCAEQTIKITVYKNLAFTMRDELSKFDILRPARLKTIQIQHLQTGEEQHV